MKRASFAVAILAAAPLAGGPSLWAQGAAGPVTRLRVAVMDLSGSAFEMQTTQLPLAAAQPTYGSPDAGQLTTVSVAIPPPSEFARGLTEILTTVLVRTGRFVVLERAAMQQLEQEQGIGAAGKTTQQTAARQGAMLGAQALITGDITGFTFDRSSVGGQMANLVTGLSVATERVSAEVIIDLRLIDATSGEILHSAKGSGKASQTGIAADLIREDKSISAEATLSTPLGQASRQAIQTAVANLLVGMPQIRWSARVVDVREGIVYLNAAAIDGMRPGLQLDVYEAGEALVDPETGLSLGAPERLLGQIVIESVLERFSTGRITSGEGIGRGHVVRLPGGK